MVDINIYEIIMQIVNFLIVLFILQKFLYKPLMGFMANRQTMLAVELTQTKKDRDEAAHLMEQQKQDLLAARQEAQNIRVKAEHVAIDEQKVIIHKAHQEAAQLIDSAKHEIRKEVHLAKNELTKEVGQLAVSVASQVLQKEVNPKLVDEYITELKK